MTHPDYLAQWERASEPLPGRPGVPAHDRGSVLAPPTPAARMAELTNLVGELRGYLGEACAEVRRLRKSDERYHRFGGVSFGGIPMAQIWADLILWETLLNENPDLEQIIEIGTWEGGFSWWLWAQARARGMMFDTYDSIRPERTIPHFHRVDVFAAPELVIDPRLIDEPLVLFCDGGNKPRELQTFSPYLHDPRSLIVVHDWGTEINGLDVLGYFPDDPPGGILEEVYGDFCDELGSISRVFRVKR